VPREGIIIKQKKMNTDLIGVIAENIAITKLLRMGFNVSKPINKCRYDLLIEKDGIISRIQVKNGEIKNDYIDFRTASISSRNKKRKQYTSEEIDFFLVVNPTNENLYLIDVNDCSNGRQRLRISETKNNQKKGILFAKDYLLRD
jgi:hypothetical protein